MKVTIDTNIIVQDFWFDSPHSRVFIDSLGIIPATLHIPEIVIDEAVNKYYEFLTENINSHKQINQELFRLLKKEIESPIHVDVTKAADFYREYLDTKFKDLKTEILGYPKMEHKSVVKKILERRRPFKKGDSGYRDFLIWETIKHLELWGTEEIVFITNNTKDFGENGTLSAEFTDKLTGNKNFRISTSISKFNDEFIIPRLKKLEQLKQQLIKGEVEKFNFKKWLDKEFVDFLENTELEEVLTGFPYGVGRVRFTEVLLYDDYKIDSVSQLNSGEKLIRFSIKCKVNASIDIDWEDYVNHKEVRDYMGEPSKEFSFSSWMTAETLEVDGYLILDKKNEEVNSFEITSLVGPKGSIEMGI